MPYGSRRAQGRRSIRLKGFDYTQPGAYSVTIIVRDRAQVLGHVVGGKVALSRAGQVVRAYWGDLPRHFPNVELGAFVVMPNHVHGILVLVDRPREGDAASSTPQTARGIARDERHTDSGADSGGRVASTNGPMPGSLGAVVGNFKAVTARRINRIYGTSGAPFWQRNYHERVIRNEREFKAIGEYIQNNPLQWELDTENVDTSVS